MMGEVVSLAFGYWNMKTIIPINIDKNGVAKTITTHYHKAGGSDFLFGIGGCLKSYHTAVMEIMNEDAKVEQVGNLIPDREGMFHNAQRGRVFSAEGIAPCIHTMGGGNLEPKILLEMEKPKSCASRQRGDKHKLETRKDDVANCVTSIDTDSMIAEPAVLTNRRTEEGKELRKQGVEKFENRQLVPREDGCSGALTTVQKDNLLQEPTDPTFLRYGFGHGAQGANKDMAYSVKASAFEANNFIVEGRDKAASELRDIASNSRSCEVDVTINPDNSLRPYNAETKAKDGISEYVTQHEDNPANTVTSAHGGNVYGNATRYRIRKLTEREVFRLMDVSEEDIDKIQAAGISKTAQYRLAGNSIVVNVLYELFRKMFVQTECETQQLSLF